ncbi:MAG: hypothetical protein RIC35_01090 [Marinoscillum sp.]
MNKFWMIIRQVVHIGVFVILTILTQIGGVIYLATLILSRKLNLSKLKSLLLFSLIYLLCAVLIIPLVAPIFGRTPLPLYGSLRPLNVVTCLLNRHYVAPDLKTQLIKVSGLIAQKHPGSKINYLDANFPFINQFPLFPHLSHNDGKKVDLAFYYRDSESGERSDSAPSFMGYGIYDGPTAREVNYPEKCEHQGHWQYDLITHLIPKWNESKYVVDKSRTRELIRQLSISPGTDKIFIEPHLKQRWNLMNYDNIRYHGCQAVRHDDHIHLQIK